MVTSAFRAFRLISFHDLHKKNRLIAVDLDASIGPGPSPEAEHERRVAIYDLIEENSFGLLNGKEGPYRLAFDPGRAPDV